MAVSKMEKVTFISDKKNQENLLKTIQGIQSVEIRDIFKETANNEWVKSYFSEYDQSDQEDKVNAVSKMILEIGEAIRFIEHHGEKKQKKQHLKRKELSLKELESSYTEELFFDKLQQVLRLKQEWKQVEKHCEKLMEEEVWLSNWRTLDISPKKVKSRETNLILAQIRVVNFDFFKEEIRKMDVYLETVNFSETTAYIAILFLRQSFPELEKIMEKYGVTEEQYIYERTPKIELQEVKKKLDKEKEKQKRLAERLGAYNNYIQELEWAEEVLLATVARESVKERFIQETHFIVIQGWISVDEKQELLQIMEENLEKGVVYTHFEEPTRYEIEEEVPTKLKNNPLVSPFEMLTEMYSLPKYKEIDPTPWMMPFYFVFFGMMVADIGYGMLIFLGAFLIKKFMVLPRNLARFINFFEILVIPSIIWGFIYSSFFGQTLPKEIMGISLPFPILSTTKDVNTILILSVIFGLIQIFVGLFVAANEHIKRQDYLSAVNDGFAWQGTLVGIILILFGAMLTKNQKLVYLGIVIVAISASFIFLIPILQSSSKVKGVAKGAYKLYGLTSYIGDLVSYTRLMALGIAGGSIATAFNMLVSFMPTPARFSIGIILLMLLHVLNMFLTLLGAYVHGARLQYVEFFGKFFTGGGRVFNPLKTAEKYVNINYKKKYSYKKK